MREDVWNNSKFSQIPQDICSEDYISSLQKLEPRIEEFIRDHNGNHVIQKCIEAMEPEDKQIILNRYDNKVSKACHIYMLDLNSITLAKIIL